MIKNILITGGAGYIGSHISEILEKEKKNIIIVDNLSTGYKRLINKKSVFYKININNQKLLKSIINKHQIELSNSFSRQLSYWRGEKILFF